MTLDKLNALSKRDAVTFFRQCCGSVRWATVMAERLPYTDIEVLLAAANEIWNAMGPEEWKEAFSHHPRIGDIKDLRKRFSSAGELAAGEQSGVSGTPETTLKMLSEGNALYEAKFGYIFIVCATGKSADEMLRLLNERLDNRPLEEIRIAAAEQAKITRLRIQKLLSLFDKHP
ncbi:MAG TPA: 2-oxo-4-hydroxy-4-carboxy-5-ureidoimidazoline decarboxylase [Bacteroidota bacterium]|nr:2-oxo-4-hydroxy-4-carboxy-5-ureidoimidazoline decarboxylase [Bacteroidota bacterium]